MQDSLLVMGECKIAGIILSHCCTVVAKCSAWCMSGLNRRKGI